MDWRNGGWTGSLNACVRREVRDHIRSNEAVQRARRPLMLRVLHWLLAERSFAGLVVSYLVLDVVAIFVELGAGPRFPDAWPRWAASATAQTSIEALLSDASGKLIAAQVGALGVVSIAIALVTLIAQREGASTDVRVYYHESLAFQVVASCIALLLVLCVQLVWPLQLLAYRTFGSVEHHFSKLALLGVHIGWLALNLTALAHFVATTLRFVQESAREKLRQRYTASVVIPSELTERLRHQLYRGASFELLDGDASENQGSSQPTSLLLGLHIGSGGTTEIERNFSRSSMLYDVRMILVRWAVRRWSARCRASANAQPATQIGSAVTPQLSFPISLDAPLRGNTTLCLRRGGIALDRVERAVLRLAFRFRKVSNEA